MPSVPESCCSIGAATVCAIVSALAPGYAVVMVTVGGEISGYCETGSENDAMMPASVIRIAMTLAKIGRSMKNREKLPMEALLALGGLGGRRRRWRERPLRPAAAPACRGAP